jgi:hypothetical protein
VSDEQEKPPFRILVPTDRAPSATLSALLEIQASIDALAVALFYALSPDMEASRKLARLYAEQKKERLLELAFNLQDAPPAGSGETEEGSPE